MKKSELITSALLQILDVLSCIESDDKETHDRFISKLLTLKQRFHIPLDSFELSEVNRFND